jgi:hypothetical protein
MWLHLLIACFSIVLSAQNAVNSGNAQTGNWKLLWTAEVKGNSVEVDNLGDIYVLANQDVIKYKSSGQLFRSYSNKSLGNISRIDVSNPLKILVFYKDLSRLVFVDNTLSEQKENVYLERFEREFASLACTSNDENGIWLYDPVAFSLTRYNQKMNIKAEVLNINQLTGKAINPVWMTERGNRLYLVDSQNGIMMFDIFGTYLKTLPIKGLTKLWVDGELLVTLNENKELIISSSTGLEQKSIALPENNFTDMCWNAGKVYVLNKNRLTVYETSN